MFLLPDVWTWDAWFVDDGHQFHAFYLKASRALGDPHRRHDRATVGHAVSDDLRTWTEVADALVPSDGPGFDDLAIWTGSVVRGPDGVWRMFYTGRTRGEPGMRQRVGVALSDDLLSWRADPDQSPVVADGALLRAVRRLGVGQRDVARPVGVRRTRPAGAGTCSSPREPARGTCGSAGSSGTPRRATCGPGASSLR